MCDYVAHIIIFIPTCKVTTCIDVLYQVDMMVHPLHTISYVADIDNVLVMMAHVQPVYESTPPSPTLTPVQNKEKIVPTYTPKMTCHVLDTENVS